VPQVSSLGALADSVSLTRQLSIVVKTKPQSQKDKNESEHNYFNSISLLKNSMAVWPTCSVS
jgi:hypothetical protein